MAFAYPPFASPIAVPKNKLDPGAERLPALKMGADFQRYFSEFTNSVTTRPERRTRFTPLTGQTASIAVTSLPITGVVEPGLWQVSYTVRVTTAGGTGEIRVTIHWTERAVTQTAVGTNLTANTTTTREGAVVVLRADSATPISYSTTYASTGTAMQYSLDVAATLVAADAG